MAALNKRSLCILFLLYIIPSSNAFSQTSDSNSIVICIAPLSNNTGEEQYDALAEGFSDILSAQLSEQKDIKVVERRRLIEILNEQKLSLRGITEPPTFIKVGKLLKADQIFIGGITKIGENFNINIHAYQVDTARLITSAQVQSKPEEIVSSSLSLLNELSKKLSIPLKHLDPNEIDKNPDASFYFMKGLSCFYTADYDKAIIQFMKTIDRDPLNTKSRLWAAKSYMCLKEYRHAEIELKKIINVVPDCPEKTEANALLLKCRLLSKN